MSEGSWKNPEFSVSIQNELATDERIELEEIRRERAEIERFRLEMQLEREKRDQPPPLQPSYSVRDEHQFSKTRDEHQYSPDKDEIDRYEQIKILAEKEEFIKREEERIERERSDLEAFSEQREREKRQEEDKKEKEKLEKMTVMKRIEIERKQLEFERIRFMNQRQKAELTEQQARYEKLQN